MFKPPTAGIEVEFEVEIEVEKLSTFQIIDNFLLPPNGGFN